MNAIRVAAYHGSALLAMLAHLVLVGPFALLYLYMSPYPIHVLPTVVLKAVIVVTWCGAFVLGVVAWQERRRRVVLVPVLSFGLIWTVGQIGTSRLGWSLGFLY